MSHQQLTADFSKLTPVIKSFKIDKSYENTFIYHNIHPNAQHDGLCRPAYPSQYGCIPQE